MLPRSHTLSSIGSHLLLFGGWGLGGLQTSADNKRPGSNSVFIYDLNDSIWKVPEIRREIEPKYGHTATVLGGSLFVFGGWNGKQALNSLIQITIKI